MTNRVPPGRYVAVSTARPRGTRQAIVSARLFHVHDGSPDSVKRTIFAFFGREVLIIVRSFFLSRDRPGDFLFFFFFESIRDVQLETYSLSRHVDPQKRKEKCTSRPSKNLIPALSTAPKKK